MKLNIYHKAFCEHCTSEIGLNFLGCLECLLLLNNLNHCRVVDFKLFGNSLVAIGYCFSKTIGGLRHCVNTHLKSPD